MKSFTQYICNLYNQEASQLFASEPDSLRLARQNAIAFFEDNGLPNKKMELWRQCPIDDLISTDYQLQREPNPYRPVEEYFKCKVQNLNTLLLPFLNGWYVHSDKALSILDNGIILGSLTAAIQQYPHLVLPYLTHSHSEKKDHGLIAMNEAMFNDGLFIFIPDNVKVDKPLQLVSMIDSNKDLLIQNHNLIIVGQNASLSLVHCDDSIRFTKTLINNVTEIHLAANATMNYTKTENKDQDSLLVNHLFVHQKQNSNFLSHAITFNAGYLHNSLHVNLEEPFAQTKLYGLYLADKNQVIDNQVFVSHDATDCTSYQLYKGIADDSAKTNFNGHILVRKDSQRTSAYQTNRNIALTDDAKVTTHPFLEIYADDVKCSHGATVGQLNDEALFYLRSRGIGEKAARMLLMYAFANEVTDLVEIDSLRERLSEMTQRRLSGELTLCDQCMIHTSNEKALIFNVDPNKIIK